MIAIKRLQSIMWILIVAVGALSAYLISLRVATERNAVATLERQIYATRANIRYLEVEFGARASLRQLEAWNAQDIRYSTPEAGQYLKDEQQLAALDRIAPSGQPYDGPPVMAAMAAAEPAQAMPVKVSAPAREEAGFSLVKAAVAAEPTARAVVARAEPKIPSLPTKILPMPAKASVKAGPALAVAALDKPRAPGEARIVRLADKPSAAEAKRASRLALLDAKLLDAGTLRTLGKADR